MTQGEDIDYQNKKQVSEQVNVGGATGVEGKEKERLATENTWEEEAGVRKRRIWWVNKN